MARPPATSLNIDPVLLGAHGPAGCHLVPGGPALDGAAQLGEATGALRGASCSWSASGSRRSRRSPSITCSRPTCSRCSSSWGRCRRSCSSRCRGTRDRPRPCRQPLRLAVHPVVAIVAVNAGFIAWHVTPGVRRGARQLVAVRPDAGEPAAGIAAVLVADRHSVLTARESAHRVRQARVHRPRHDSRRPSAGCSSRSPDMCSTRDMATDRSSSVSIR